MKAVIQRVSSARVTVAGETTGQIERGLVVLLGVARGDTPEDARTMADKVVGLRIFDDEQGKMNLALRDVGGAILAVSQFTLLADCHKGRRPSYLDAAPPEEAEALYEDFVAAARALGVTVACGRFRTMMHVELVNEGPVTICLDTRA